MAAFGRTFLVAVMVGVGVVVAPVSPVLGYTLAGAGVVLTVISMAAATRLRQAITAAVLAVALSVPATWVVLAAAGQSTSTVGGARGDSVRASETSEPPETVDEMWSMTLDFAEEKTGDRQVSDASLSLNPQYLSSNFGMSNSDRVRAAADSNGFVWETREGYEANVFDGELVTADISAIAKAVAEDGYGQAFRAVNLKEPEQTQRDEMANLGFTFPEGAPVLWFHSADATRPWRAEAGPDGSLPHTFHDPQNVEESLDLVEQLLIDAGISPASVEVATIDASPHMNTQKILGERHSTISETSGLFLTGAIDGRGFEMTVPVGAFPRLHYSPVAPARDLVSLRKIPQAAVQSVVDESADGRKGETAWSFRAAEGSVAAQTANDSGSRVEKRF